MAQAQPFEVHYHPHINVDVTPSWDNFNYEHCTTDDGVAACCKSHGVRVRSITYWSRFRSHHQA